MAFRTSSPTGDHDAPQLQEASVPVALEVCTIERWRGYVSSTFFARLEDGTALFESKSFRARGKEPLAEEGPAAQAHADIVAALERLGWQRMSNVDDAWYSTQFSRPAAIPAVSATPIAPPQRPVDILNIATHRIEAVPERVEVMPAPLSLPPQPVAAIPEPVQVAPPPVEVEVAPPEAEAEVDVAQPQAEGEVAPPPAEVMVPPAPAVAPPANDGPRKRRRRSSKLTLVSAAGAAIAVGAVALNLAGFGKHSLTLRKAVSQTGAAAQKAQTPAATPKRAAPPKTQTTVATPPATPKTPAPTAARTLHLSIRARNVGSWIEIRRESASGPVIFSGLLPGGRTLHLKGTRLWGSFGAAGNLAIAVNGGPVKLEGTLTHTFSAPRH